MCIILVVYGLCRPYKSQVTNMMEMVVQINFIVLLALESTGFLKDQYNVFPVPEVGALNVSRNATSNLFDGKITGISTIAKILLPFYYLPLLLFFFTAVANLIIYFR